MRQPTHHITPSEALRRVFLPSPTNASRPYTTRPTLSRPNPRPQCLSRPRPYHPHPQHHHPPSNTGTWRRPGIAQPGPDRRKFGPKAGPAHPPRDREIDAYRIYLVRLGDDRLPEKTLALSDVLDALERDEKGRLTQYVQEVSPASEERPWPVCKLFTKETVRKEEEARRKASKMTKVQSKQLECRWMITDNDLEHQMTRLKGFLEKGWKVDIVFGSRRKSGWKGRKQVSLEEAEALLEKIRKVVGEVQGAQEKPMQGKIGKEAVLRFEGKPKKKAD